MFLKMALKCHPLVSKLSSFEYRLFSSHNKNVNFCKYYPNSTCKKTISNVFTFLLLLTFCCLLTVTNGQKDRQMSQNSVNILPRAESSSGESQLTRFRPEAQPDSTEPSLKPKLTDEENNTLENRHVEKPLSGERLESQQSQQRLQSEVKLKVQEGEAIENETTTESDTRFKVAKTKPTNGTTESTEIDKNFPARNHQTIPNKRIEKEEVCPPKSLVHYNITFVPMWSSKRFPKMYPTYRPHAQWSRAIGRTHDYSYSMWKLDTFASPAVKSFAEKGFAADFETETQGEGGIFDMFTMPAIYKGIGTSKGSVFLDGMHPQVSLMVKIIPSPDWFVGVSGLNLCSKGKWRKKAVVKLFPVDAGTDKGLTFTSPNWPSYPPEKIYRITSSFPSHEANSFHYPKLKKLPRIGYVIFHKTTEARTIFKRQKPYKIHLASVSSRSSSAAMRKEKAISNGSRKPTTTLVQSDQRPGDKNPEKPLILSNEEPQLRRTMKLAFMDKETGTALDCLVSNWGHWSGCTKTCGFGRRERHRFVTQQRKNHGLICPNLKEDELCGSMRNCKWNHFQPFRWQTLQRPSLTLSKRH